MDSHQRRLDRHEAIELLRKAYARNPNPSGVQLDYIAKKVGRSASTVSKWFDKERGGVRPASQTSVRKSHSQESLTRETTQFDRPVNGIGLKKRLALPRQELLKRDAALARQELPPVKEPQPTLSKPVLSKQPVPSVVQPQTAQPQTAQPQTTLPQTAPFKATPQPAPSPKGNDISMTDQSETVHQNVPENNWGDYPLPDPSSVLAALEGLPKLQHEVHCAMALYYQATLALPMTFS